MQRFFDVYFCCVALLVLTPLFLIVAVVLRVTGDGEILYRQRRVGKGGEPFYLYKFVTMREGVISGHNKTLTIENDKRILPVGHVLRRLKINELPQLFNILRGDMSVIGPRPQTPECFAVFPKSAQKVITEVSPGLSGIGSIAFHNEEAILHSRESGEFFYEQRIMPFKAKLEEWYVENRSLRNYFILIFLTIWVMLFSRADILWKFFPTLPKPDADLAGEL
jgi:lipopolysaccharide/colanic/teichoic acid biosynthesis glycosyltransferase